MLTNRANDINTNSGISSNPVITTGPIDITTKSSVSDYSMITFRRTASYRFGRS